MGGPKSVACPQSLRCRQSQMEELLQPSVEAICMALFGIVERLSATGMGAALEEAARGFEVFGELSEIGRVVLVATRALDGRAASLLGWRLAAERGARARHHALHGADQRGLDAAGAGCGHQGCPYACRRPCACSYRSVLSWYPSFHASGSALCPWRRSSSPSR